MKSKPPRFDFYEKVIIRHPGHPFDGEVAAVLGRVQDSDGKWVYAVHIYSTPEGWDEYEDWLEPTGEFDRRETFYDGSVARVAVDQDGRGEVVEFLEGASPPREQTEEE